MAVRIVDETKDVNLFSLKSAALYLLTFTHHSLGRRVIYYVQHAPTTTLSHTSSDAAEFCG